MLHALVFPALRDRGIERVVQPGRTEDLAVTFAKALHRVRVQHDLRGRRQLDPGDRLDRALAVCVETARAFENISEKVEPHRRRLAGRKDVDDPAAHRIVARLDHGRGPVEALGGQPRQQRIGIDQRIGGGGKGGLGQDRASRNPLGRARDGCQDNARPVPAVDQRGQGRHPGRRDLRIGRDPVIGQAIPGRKSQHRQAGREKRQRLGHGGGPGVVAGHMDYRPAGPFDKVGQKFPVPALGRTANGDGARG